jgi:uncharacterized membrane protein
MNPVVNQWLDLILRWSHVFLGILWVGTTYYFTWLDGRFSELESAASGKPKEPSGAENRVWMVHSGGFYQVEKHKVPAVMPEKLHWFRWEAALTWLTGLLLFAIVYYHGHAMVPPDEWPVSHGAAVWLSIGLLAVAWLLYDLLWKFVGNEIAGVVISYGLIVGTAFGLSRAFSARAACLQLGAMFGTIMAANVWMRILPAQRRMVAALKDGREPNQVEARRAKMRSKHNTFIVIPVIFLMLSGGHFQWANDWRLVSALVLAGWIAARFIRRA